MNQPTNSDAKIKIGIPLYPTFDSLDVMGPYQVFTYAPNLELHLVAATLNAVTSLEGVRVMPELSFDQCPKLDVLLVPGASDLVSPLKQGPLGSNELLDFLVRRAEDAQLVCSVCTGALLLGAAGLLDGHMATTHWSELQTLELFPLHGSAGLSTLCEEREPNYRRRHLVRPRRGTLHRVAALRRGSGVGMPVEDAVPPRAAVSCRRPGRRRHLEVSGPARSR